MKRLCSPRYEVVCKGSLLRGLMRGKRHHGVMQREHNRKQQDQLKAGGQLPVTFPKLAQQTGFDSK